MSLSRSSFTVSEITSRIKELIEGQFFKVGVRGEISNFKHHSSGHMYFTIKDKNAELRAVMFRGMNQSLHFKPEDGMDVLVQGRITVYEPRGQYQMLAETMEPAGIGTLYLAFEALKNQLSSEGLFDESHKQLIPAFPETVAVVTSETGAALRDILQVMNRRSPQIKVLIRPARVQGNEATRDLTQALVDIQSHGEADVIIFGRGGGSLEDLWPFNEESVVRAIHQCKIPIISGIGHETDMTLSDLVSDLRATTPSAAAEMVSSNTQELGGRISSAQDRLNRVMTQKFDRNWQSLDRLSDRVAFHQPKALLKRYGESLSHLETVLSQSIGHRLAMAKTKLTGFDHELHALNPLTILNRGYAIALNKKGAVIRGEKDLKSGELFSLKTGKGSLLAEKKKSLPES